MAGHVEVGGAAAAAGDDDVKKEVPQLLSVSWNQNRSCFTAATTADFRVFRCCPFGEHLRRVHEDGGGFTVAEMLFRSNIFATVSSSSSSSSFSSSNNNNNNNNRDHFMVKVWDDITHKCLWQRGFPTAVRSVRVSRERIAVVVDRIVRVYPLFKPTRLVCKVETTHNPRGLCCLSCRSDETTVLACPGTVKGQVRVERLDEDTTRFIDAHSSDVACMEMTLDGTVLATASVKGTLVRVFNTVDGTCLQEVRRGRDNAEIHSIALSPDLRWLAVSSNKGTLHVFSLRIGAGAGQNDAADVPSAASASLARPNTVPNARSSLSFMKGFLPNYFSSEWSFAQFHLPEATRYIVAFGEQNIVMTLGMDASFYKCSFDPVKGGEKVRKEFFRFLHDKNTPDVGTLSST